MSKIIIFFVNFILFLFISGCTTPVAKETIFFESTNSFSRSNGGLIILNSVNNNRCTPVDYTLKRKENQEIYSSANESTIAYSGKSQIYDSTYPIPIHVPTGHYKLVQIICHREGYIALPLDGLEIWNPYFEVNEGEVIYPGSLKITEVDVKYSVDGLFLKEDSSTLFGYEMADYSDDLKKRLRILSPDLANRMVTRISNEPQDEYMGLPPQLFLLAMKRAYAPLEDGTLPSKEEARARAPIELDKILNSLRSAE